MELNLWQVGVLFFGNYILDSGALRGQNCLVVGRAIMLSNLYHCTIRKFSDVRVNIDFLFTLFCFGQSYHLLFGQLAQVVKACLPKNWCDRQKGASPRSASVIVRAYRCVVNRYVCGRIGVCHGSQETSRLGWPFCLQWGWPC